MRFEKIKLSNHARKRMHQRNIPRNQILRTLNEPERVYKSGPRSRCFYRQPRAKAGQYRIKSMRIELDTEANALYLYIRDELQEGEAVRTLEVEEGVYLDLDADNHPLGLEFLHAEGFQDFIKRHGGRIQIPAVVEDLDSLQFSPV